MTRLALVLLALTATSATAEPRNCANRAHVLERLSTVFGESRQSIGLAANNNVLEVFASIDTGSWSVTVTTPQGVTCLIASGSAFETLAEVLIPGNPA